ncbi:MAG TPA: DUF72 domain-containing protein [Flavisolibacter sp.]|nr:DUF72 domain-containing protein [Flavisolibacter sp.]
MASKIHIGTSGWSYKHWKGVFYPPKLKATSWLPYYTDYFKTTEINTSFYHLPKITTIEKWMGDVPVGFRFSVKMSRYLTHMKKLRDPEESLERFFEIFDPMKKVMGPVLIQLPPSLKFNYEVAGHLYQLLYKKYKSYRFVMEVRHPEWLKIESLELMKKYNIGFVISQSGVNFPYAEMITAKDIYIRFHGPAELYASSYTDNMLKKFLKLFVKWVNEGHEIWAYFNNDIHGYAIENARRLNELAEKGKSN